MKITKTQLQQLIQEETQKLLQEDDPYSAIVGGKVITGDAARQFAAEVDASGKGEERRLQPGQEIDYSSLSPVQLDALVSSPQFELVKAGVLTPADWLKSQQSTSDPQYQQTPDPQYQQTPDPQYQQTRLRIPLQPQLPESIQAVIQEEAQKLLGIHDRPAPTAETSLKGELTPAAMTNLRWHANIKNMSTWRDEARSVLQGHRPDLFGFPKMGFKDTLEQETSAVYEPGFQEDVAASNVAADAAYQERMDALIKAKDAALEAGPSAADIKNQKLIDLIRQGN